MNNVFFQDKMVNSNRVLYTPSAFAKNNLIHLQEIGTLTAQSQHTSKRSRLASFLFFCVKSGSGTLIYEGITYSLKKGDCVFLDCQKTYSHSTSEDLWTLQWAHFYGPNLDKIYENYMSENPSPVFTPLFTHSYEGLLTDLQEITASNSGAKDMMICEKLTGLLALILQDCEQGENQRIIPFKALVLVDVKKYLDEHFREKITLEDLSALFFIDKYYLSRRFKQYYGTTVNTYLQQAKITHAKHLLRFSNQSIESVAIDCGIDDANYFARLFKKIEGVSPGAFRKSWQGSK